MRDLRDPQKLGEALLKCRGIQGKDADLSQVYDEWSADLDRIPAYSSVHQDGPLNKYGSPSDVQPKFQTIQVV